MIEELAPAKANLVLQVGGRRGDGLHEICSLFASLELADLVTVEPAPERPPGDDRVECPAVPAPNLAATALAAYRAANPSAAPEALTVRIDKRIPVAAGLGGGSADAAAVLRAGEALAARRLGAPALRSLGARLGADVPSQIEPGHALVTGAGERIEPLPLPPMSLVLVPQGEGLSTASVYAEADRLGTTRARLDPTRVRVAARAGALAELLPLVANDLEAAALALRPELRPVLNGLRECGAAAALVTGSGPTVVGLFAEPGSALRAAAGLEGALVTGLRGGEPA